LIAKSLSYIFTILVLSACTLTAVPTSPTSTSTETALPIITTVVDTPTERPSSTPTATIFQTQISNAVSVTAKKGNLFIRRGPDLAFNATSTLLDGETERALARDVLSKWVEIPIPGQPGITGWISIQTQYSVVSGDVISLPEISPPEWPVLAFLRNCTHDQMFIEPTGTVLPSLLNFPLNDVQINPGIYRIFDSDVNDYPEVSKVEVREGSAIDIVTDGNGIKRKCPMP